MKKHLKICEGFQEENKHECDFDAGSGGCVECIKEGRLSAHLRDRIIIKSLVNYSTKSKDWNKALETASRHILKEERLARKDKK